MSVRVGIVGVGRMGANMARRLQDVGEIVAAVYDVHTENAAALATELGCLHATKLAEVTAVSDVIFTVVPDDAAMATIFAAEGDSLLINAAGKTFINFATLTPDVHVDAGARAAAAGAWTLEAGMASSITQARNGTLYLMVAGEEAVFASQRALLEKLSLSLRYVGTAGQAARVKALVNMVMNINTAGLAEGLALGEALGINLTMLREIFAQTGAHSRVLETDGEDMQNRDHACFFSAAHAAKDSGIALALAQECGVVVPLAAAAKQQFDAVVAAGLGDLDKSGVAELTFKSRRPPGL